MNFTAPFLALMFGAATLFGQEAVSPAPVENGVLLAQTSPAGKENAITSINDHGARDKAPAAASNSSGDSSSGSGGRSGGNYLVPPTSGGFNPVTLWKLIESGGWVMVAIGFLSVVTVMLVFTYLFTLRRGAILTPHYMNTADVLLKKRDYLGLLAISSRHGEAVARVVQRTLDFATKNPTASYEVVREIAETEAASQAASLQHRTVYLADIGMLAPMIGLLGTVIGIISSFGDLAHKDASQSRDMLLAGGVSQALVATASGLVLGITAMFFYSLFRNRVQSLISDLEIASAHILGLIALNFNKKREQSRVAVDEEF
ncbi:MotA/TolQ/ExbB proton channel [Chthoniobacter flavus Ellin428]|uniref:MotA/TolQ/ExbB proton channel n=1 Tax=Chthoniobacter flavus Ellin428 TaxID=497964 RepID=B4CU01_9BACT|nr:MotA/TolQ/ExbB proton channel family protein [Chthoniobacter flavus]EDY22039.1 MotA/TolQ/ExbB proton channel [Chthoniobacter flavus Ellin428]TCO89426.1 biopolymer transport protein ExbB/TolQ [Chthoniobacter flavus]